MDNPIRPIISSINPTEKNTVGNTKYFVHDITASKFNDPLIMTSVDIFFSFYVHSTRRNY